MSHVLVIAPHPDDEVLGAGGTLLRKKAEGARVSWLTVTGMDVGHGFSESAVAKRRAEMESVASGFEFDTCVHLALRPAGLDALPLTEIIDPVAAAVRELAPDTVILPAAHDVHSDHSVVHRVGLACTKAFRFASVRKVLAMEIPSETDLGPQGWFTPDYLVDVGAYLERKLELLQIYEGEVAPSPHPRSLDAVRALATVRGALAGCRYAEAFKVLRWVE